MSLKVSKGIQIKSKCLATTHFYDDFIGSFQDKTVRIYNNSTLEKAEEYELEIPAKSLSAMDQQTLLAGG